MTDGAAEHFGEHEQHHEEQTEGERYFAKFLEYEARMRQSEERAQLEEELRRKRPRWPPRAKGVRPQIEAAMKHKIRRLARDVMSLVGLTGRELEDEMMTSIAKGMTREGLKVFQEPKKLLLRHLGRRSLFKEMDEVDEEVSDEEEPAQEEYWVGEEEEHIPIYEDTEEEVEESEDDLLDFLYHPEKYDRYYQKSEPQEEQKKGEEEKEEEKKDEYKEEMGEDEMLGYPWRTFQDFFRGECDEVWGEGVSFAKGRLTKDVGFDMPRRASPQPQVDMEEERKKRRLRRRKICRLTLVRCGNTRRQDLGYMDGWTDSGPELGEDGKNDLEIAALALLNRGFKFDKVYTSMLSVSKTVADKVLEATGQANLRRLQCSELNPRHLGDLEGQTEAGLSSAFGWMLGPYSAFRGPPLIKESHPHWYRQAGGEPLGDPSHPKAETVFHVLARLGVFWSRIKNSFIREGGRSILVVGHDDSIRALLFHILALHPTDFSQWEPSSAHPMVLFFEKKEANFGLAAVDFITSPVECKKQIVGLCKAMLERHIDSGILDKYAVKEIKRRVYQGRQVPSVEDIYRCKRKEAYNMFEREAKVAGKRERAMERLMKQYRHNLPEIGVQKFSEFLAEMQRRSGGDKEEMPVEERVDWIAENVLGVANKIGLLRELKANLPPDATYQDATSIDETIRRFRQQAKHEAEWQKQQQMSAIEKKAVHQPAEVMDHWKCQIEALKQGWMDILAPEVTAAGKNSSNT